MWRLEDDEKKKQEDEEKNEEEQPLDSKAGRDYHIYIIIILL